MKNINLTPIWKGHNIAINAIQINNKCPVQDFLDGLAKLEQKKTDKLFYLFDLQNGQLTNKQKIRKLHFACDHCFEFKPTEQVRISFIYLRRLYNAICLLDGFKKKKKKWPNNKIKKTEQLCKIIRIYEENLNV